jgi:phytoene dehydrogenase-like protein
VSLTYENSYDVIIIGAGISGLVCGCYLAKAGMKVLVVEQHDKPGGYCTSFRRKGFLFDAAAHSFGSYREGGHFRKIMTDLGIDKLIKIRRFDPSDIIISPDFKLSFYNDFTKTLDGFTDIFPDEKENIIRFFKAITNIDQREAARLTDKPFIDLLKGFFNDSRLINTISTPVFGNGGLPPSLLSAFTGSKIFLEFLLDGGYYPEGGMQSLPNAMAAFIQQNGGELIYKKLVKKIIHENGTVIGVSVENNDIYNSKYVVSACDSMQTFKTLLGENITGKDRLNKITSMTPAISTFILYLAIDKPFNELPPVGANIWYLPYYDLEKYYHAVNLCNFSEAGGYMLRVSPDERTILAFFLAPFISEAFWEQNKKNVAQDFLSRVEKLIPNLKKHIVYFDAATPYTLYKYTLNNQGANYGWAPTPSQLFDPDFRQKSFIKGLYLTGHWVTQTHGIPGVAYLGYNTAKLILKREKITT